MKTSTVKKSATYGAWAILFLAFVAIVVAFAGRDAKAAPGDSIWVAKHDSTIVNENSVLLNGGNTSVEAANLGVEVEANTVVTFFYGLDAGAKCTAGAPRVFMKVGEVYHNSWDQNIGAGTQCGTDGKVTFTLPDAGTVTEAGVVYDNGQLGTVLVSNLSIGEVKVNFKDSTPSPTPTTTSEPTPTSTPTVEPTVGPTSTPTSQPTTTPTATSEPSSTPSSAPSTVGPEPTSTTEVPSADPIPVGNNTDDTGGLALTGSSFIPGMVLFGTVLIGGGGLLFYLSRRRREVEQN